MYLSFINPKIKTLLDFWVFVFNTLPKANSEIAEIPQKRHNIEI